MCLLSGRWNEKKNGFKTINIFALLLEGTEIRKKVIFFLLVWVYVPKHHLNDEISDHRRHGVHV